MIGPFHLLILFVLDGNAYHDILVSVFIVDVGTFASIELYLLYTLFGLLIAISLEFFNFKKALGSHFVFKAKITYLEVCCVLACVYVRVLFIKEILDLLLNELNIELRLLPDLGILLLDLTLGDLLAHELLLLLDLLRPGLFKFRSCLHFLHLLENE